jgi:hypothetical protein
LFFIIDGWQNIRYFYAAKVLPLFFKIAPLVFNGGQNATPFFINAAKCPLARPLYFL